MKDGGTWRIRDADPADAEGIAAIYAPIVRDTAISFEEVPPDAAEMARRMRDVTRAYPYLVAERDGAVAGYAYAGPHHDRSAYRFSAHVTIYVASRARGAGIGRALYARLLDALAERDFHRAYALIALPNGPSVALHEAMGFRHAGTLREVGFKFDRWHDVGWWERALG